MDDEEFLRWYGPWSPRDVGGVETLLDGFEAPWWVVGGYAIERFTGVARRHDDIDIAVLRPDAPQLLRFLAPTSTPGRDSSGSLTPMLGGRDELPLDAGQIWIRRGALSPWEVDFVVGEERDGSSVWRHNPAVTMTVAELTWIDEAGCGSRGRMSCLLTRRSGDSTKTTSTSTPPGRFWTTGRRPGFMRR